MIGVAMTLFIFLLWVFNAFESVELSSLNWRFTLRGAKPAAAPAVIVAIDDESLNGWSDDAGRSQYMPDRWTWPRTFYAQVVQNLAEAGASVIAFDLVFSESSKGGCYPGQDKAFAEACQKAGNVVMGIRYAENYEQGLLKRKAETLIPALAAAAADSGVVHAVPDVDQVMRKLPLSDSVNREVPSLDLAVYRQWWSRLPENRGKPRPLHSFDGEEAVLLADLRAPVLRGHVLQVNFIGEAQSFPTFPFHSVYYKTMDMSVFKDKVVYIGATTEILHDNHPTPFHPNIKMPGVEIHANALDTLISREFLMSLSGLGEMLILFSLGLLTSFLTFRMSSWRGVAVAAVLGFGYTVICVIAFTQARWVLPMISPLASVFMSFAGITAWKQIVEERRAREIRNQFSRYVSRSIVDEILKDPSKISLGGQSKEVTILFSDVRGFTAMSERLKAEEVVSILNEYLTAMVDIVIANGGTLDKYVGDAIMAIWGSPLPDPQHQRKAVTCAVQMMEKLSELQAKWEAEGKPPIDIGIGLNSGRVVAGNMGHLHYKMDYTVIGDDVNLAARLESANKEMHSHVLISGTTLQGCADLVEVVEHQPIKVKGKEKSVQVFEVVGWKGKRASWAKPLP